MNTLNDSVIICDMTPKSSKKKTPLGTKKPPKNLKKTFYESPLKHIQLSNKRWKQMQKEQKLIRDARQINNNRKNSFSLMKDVSLQDSIIILSDNENDSSNQKDQSNCTKTKKRKKSLETLTEDRECSTFLHDSNKCLCQKDAERCPKRRRRNSPSLPDNDSSCLLISDTEDSDVISIDVDNENIAPASNSINQNSDDIIVVWSSKNNSCTSSKNNSVDEKSINDEENKIFMVDCTPNPENLSYLECNEESTSNECEINTKRSNEKSSKECSENNTEKINEKNSKQCSEEDEETSDEEEEPKYLPFSKQGLKLPRAHNISKKLLIKKPQRKNTFLNYRRHLTRSSNNRIPVIEPSRSEPVSLESSKLEPPSLEPSSFEPPKPEASSSEPPKPEPSIPKPSNKLREIIVDGNNVAMAHKNNRKFSEEGIILVTNYFQKRGHSVKVFLPQYRRSKFTPLLEELYKEGIVVFTPSRRVGSRCITPYDDRYILQYATVSEGIIISNDQFRDLYQEKPEWRNTIENRVLAPTFVGDYVMFPEDPLGRNGPNLEQFLKF